MKTIFFEINDWEKNYINLRHNNQELIFVKEPLNSKNIDLASDCQILSLFIYSKIDKRIFEKLPNLKFIATRSTGFDHIDIGAAKNRNVFVSNVPTYGENTVAEHTFALILDLSRKIYDSVKRAKEGNFTLDGLQGFDLKGKTIGIAGLGHIGQNVARIANGFKMNVLAFDAIENEKLAKGLNLEYVTLENLLKNSDIVSLHLSLNEKTKHLINKNNIDLMKKGAYLINTARGEIIETTALISAIDQGILAGAGIDVLEGECFVKEERQLLSEEFPKQCDLKTILQNHILLKQKNVIITPHNAFNSKEALERILDTTIENIRGFIKGSPINLI